MEPEELAEARGKAENSELLAQEAEWALRRWHRDRPNEEPTEESARLTVRAHVLRSLAFRDYLEYVTLVEHGSEQTLLASDLREFVAILQRRAEAQNAAGDHYTAHLLRGFIEELEARLNRPTSDKAETRRDELTWEAPRELWER